ncbi:hypothetical protein [Archangium sp.]|uniref:hypothetical protein n=1 Tax=Archangium sp. TaxID=1872627 RepID=UPI002D4D5F08|nr:hypothetical protein [Archangium sp.]HYO57616.1 hypothetical protein [Archangium sp.]
MAFDSFLVRRGLRLEAVVIGGAALNLLGIASRPIRDCDILHPELPAAILEAARAFAAEMRGRRAVLPAEPLQAESLTSAMVGIGMCFAAPAHVEANIEDTLLFASVEGMERDDLRVLAVLVTWLGVHAAWVNADRLTRLIQHHHSPRVRAFWSAFARSQDKDRRFARLAAVHEGERADLLRVGTEFQIRRHGEDERFAGTALCVPANVLRDRAADVLSSEELAQRHLTYRYRIMMGPSYRADMWAALEGDPSLTVAQLARRTYGSFATAWHVKRDFEILTASRTPSPRPAS